MNDHDEWRIDEALSNPHPMTAPRSPQPDPITSESAAAIGTFSEHRKVATTRISDFTVPPGVPYQTPEGLRAEDEPTRVAFDVQGGVYPIRESVYRASYEAVIPECSLCHHREHAGSVCNAGRGQCQCGGSR